LLEERARLLEVTRPLSFERQTLEHVSDSPVIPEPSVFREALFNVSRARFEVTADVDGAAQGADGAHA
jgi:hypothetical protein